MKKILYGILVLVSITSCSSYSVQKEVNEKLPFKKTVKLGVIMRTAPSGKIGRDSILTSISRTLNGYKPVASIEIIPDLSAQVTEFVVDDDRFFQASSDSDYLKYKSLGVLKTYLRANSDEIKKVMEKGSYEGLVIYEVYSIISVEMQVIRFNTVVAVIGKDLNPVYLDHQDNIFDSKETDLQSLQAQLLNHISNRFIGNMMDFGFIKEL